MSCSFSQNKSVPTKPEWRCLENTNFMLLHFLHLWTAKVDSALRLPDLAAASLALNRSSANPATSPVLWCNLRWRLLHKSHSNYGVGESYPRIAMLFSSNKFQKWKFSPISSCYSNTIAQVSWPGLKCIHFLVIEDHPVSLPNCPGGSPSQLLWKERCWRLETPLSQLFKDPAYYKSKNKPLYSTVSDAFRLTRISPEIRPCPSHLKLSFKDLLCTISTFQGKNCLPQKDFKNREVFDSRCPFFCASRPRRTCPQFPGSKKAQAPAWAQRLRGWWAALFGYSQAMHNWPSTGWKP